MEMFHSFIKLQLFLPDEHQSAQTEMLHVWGRHVIKTSGETMLHSHMIMIIAACVMLNHCINNLIFSPVHARKSHLFPAVISHVQAVKLEFAPIRNFWK